MLYNSTDIIDLTNEIGYANTTFQLEKFEMEMFIRSCLNECLQELCISKASEFNIFKNNVSIKQNKDKLQLQNLIINKVKHYSPNDIILGLKIDMRSKQAHINLLRSV